MTELLTAAQMRAIEQAAIESGEVTGLELMERAGQGVVEAIFEEWPELAVPDRAVDTNGGAAPDRGSAPEPPEYLEQAEIGRRVVVLCGPGNNGGDGFVVARLLKGLGWEVEVFLYADADKFPPDARVNYERWGEVGGTNPISQAEEALLRKPKNGTQLIIDSLFGTGLKRSIPSELHKTLGAVNTFGFPKLIVSVDVPSGVCSDSGKLLRNFNANFQNKPYPNELVQADLTVSFERVKPFAVLSDGPRFSGRVTVADLGLFSQRQVLEMVVGSLDSFVRMIDQPSMAEFRSADFTHKYDHGHALILSGGVGKGGAARLAARGALRIGAGVVTVGCPPSALIENAAQLNAIMLRTVKDSNRLAEVLLDKRINALCLGPGLGVNERASALVSVALDSKRSLVLDADALTILQFDEADGLFGKLHEDCVLTPHAGEFARLFPDIAMKLNAPAIKGPAYSKVDATREAAARAGCIVLFKGADTVIAAPDGRCSINSAHYERGAPWLATAGSGDVLAGFITGLLARGFAPMQAAETGAWLHVECALKFGPGLIAEDLPEQLPAVFRDLGI